MFYDKVHILMFISWSQVRVVNLKTSVCVRCDKYCVYVQNPKTVVPQTADFKDTDLFCFCIKVDNLNRTSTTLYYVSRIQGQVCLVFTRHIRKLIKYIIRYAYKSISLTRNRF